MKHRVGRRQRDVLVPAAIAVGVDPVEIGDLRDGRGAGVVVVIDDARTCVVRDVDQELVTGENRTGGRDRCVGVPFLRPGQRMGRVRCHHHQRKAVRAAHEFAVFVGDQQRRIVHVKVVELDAQLCQGLRLDVGPRGDRTGLLAVQQVTCRQRTQTHTINGVPHDVFPPKHMVRRVRGIV